MCLDYFQPRGPIAVFIVPPRSPQPT